MQTALNYTCAEDCGLTFFFLQILQNLILLYIRGDVLKLKDGYIYRQIAGEHMVIPVGANLVDFNGVISLNETAAFLWNKLREGAQEKDLVTALMDEFEVDEEVAAKDVQEFILYMIEKKILTDG